METGGTRGVGSDGELFKQWARWVEETGGDSPEKFGRLVCTIYKTDVNGGFLWIEEPLQSPIPSWEKPEFVQPWAG